VKAAFEILSELQRRGVSVAVEGDTLCLRPKRALDEEMLNRIRESKSALLETLRGRLSTCSAQCYEVAPGRWIHRPWAGCRTPAPERLAVVPSRADCECDGPVCRWCWLCARHCHGAHVFTPKTQPEPRESPRNAEMNCWQCGGEGRCDCTTCWKGGPGECGVCKGIGKVLQWVQ
jgi:TubC N-terminal docking domain